MPPAPPVVEARPVPPRPVTAPLPPPARRWPPLLPQPPWPGGGLNASLPYATRTVAAALCMVLGLGLLGGAAAGSWLIDEPEAPPVAERVYTQARALWHSTPVDSLFPPVLRGDGAGRGHADRRWVRIAIAPDSDCRQAFDPALAAAFSQVACHRLIRATYVDETTSSMTTVGLLFTEAGADGMRALRRRFVDEDLLRRTDLMPRPYAERGTAAAGFGDAQRASWTIRVLTDAPVVVYAVSGFADGRTVGTPQPAAEAAQEKETTAVAQAGLGHAAKGIADRVERRLRARVAQVAREAEAEE